MNKFIIHKIGHSVYTAPRYMGYFNKYVLKSKISISFLNINKRGCYSFRIVKLSKSK